MDEELRKKKKDIYSIQRLAQMKSIMYEDHGFLSTLIPFPANDIS